MRVILGMAGLAVLPLAYPDLWHLRAILTAYVILGAVTLILIRRGVGGQTRAIVSGALDLTLLTWIVHAVGSTHTVLLAIYIYTAVLNVLVVGPAVGRVMAVLGVTFYGLALTLEQLRWLVNHGGASALEAAVSWGLVASLTIVATSVVGRVVSRIRDHELRLRRANVALEETNAALATANEQLELLSQRDPLTELYNRRYLHERLQHELLHVRRGRDVSLLMLDLDGFKQVNDLHGHLMGDELLRRIAQALRETVRETDIVGRYGGDELAVLLPDTALDDALTAAQRLVESVREVGMTFAANAPVTASVGIAVATRDDDASELVKRADEATYRAKREGGDQHRTG